MTRDEVKEKPQEKPEVKEEKKDEPAKVNPNDLPANVEPAKPRIIGGHCEFCGTPAETCRHYKV